MKNSTTTPSRQPRAQISKNDIMQASKSPQKALLLWAKCLFPDSKKKQNEFIHAADNDVHKFLSMVTYPRNAQLCTEMARLNKAIDGQALRNNTED